MSENPPLVVTVRVSGSDLVQHKRQADAEAAIIYRLRDAGIPVRGLLLFSGVERGVLEIFDEPGGDVRVFRWREVVTA